MAPVRLHYQTVEFGDTDIHLRTLRDIQEFEDAQQHAENLGISPASWSHFGVVWDSGEVLARIMYTEPVEGLRILEVGCGIGLASIVLGSRKMDITATDHHPEAGEYLSFNAALNELPPIQFVRTGWAEESPLLTKFDLIIGSDLLYESSSPSLLAGFIDRHAASSCRVIIVDPGRGMQGKFTKLLMELGFTHNLTKSVISTRSIGYKGNTMRFSRLA